jgi:spore maturation protein CgeB
MKLLIVGSNRSGHMGNYLAAAARRSGLEYDIIDTGGAEAVSRIARSFYWRFRGRRPARLTRFGKQVIDLCTAGRFSIVLTTGNAPLDEEHLEKLHRLGVKVINYSTDDPWNPALQSSWFLSALSSYDAIFSTRRANLSSFVDCGVRAVHYLPFAYDPEIHRSWPPNKPTGASSDLLFVGGCDVDRFPFINALIDAGLNVALFGGYWNRHKKARAHWRGLVDQNTIRSASAATQICLCLVRRANRDGHVMRSFEAAAIGGCILAEDTVDHRELFGPDDQAVRYFSSVDEMVRQAKLLVADAGARRRLSIRLSETFAGDIHTYDHRLATMLALSNAAES